MSIRAPIVTGARGIALILGLLLLAAISLLAVMAANGMLLQRRMASNFEDRERALRNADLATASARAWLDSRGDVEREAGCLTDCLLPPAIHGPGVLPDDPEFESAAWWELNGILAGTNPETGAALGTLSSPDGRAHWLMEELHYDAFDMPVSGPEVDGIGFYRVLARGRGIQAGSVAVTESIVAKPWEGGYQPAAYPPSADTQGFCQQFDGAVPCGMLAWRQRK